MRLSPEPGRREPDMTVDLSKLSEEKGKRFGGAIMAGLREYLRQPGAMEVLEARTKARQERLAGENAGK